MIKPENYVSIHGWMITDLGLKGNELIVYALIYGFTQDGETRFTGSTQYVADWIGGRKPTAIDVLKRLRDSGLIEASPSVPGLPITYRAVTENVPVRKAYRTGTETVPDRYGKRTTTGTETVPNNILDTLKDTNIDNMAEPLKQSVIDWFRYKKERRQPYTQTGKQKLISQIETAARQYGAAAVSNVIDRSISANYQGIVFDWLKNRKKQPTPDDYGNGNFWESI